MSATREDMLALIRKLRAAAKSAHEAEIMADAAQNFDAEEAFWLRYNDEVATIMGKLLGVDHQVTLDRIEALLGGAP